MPRIAGVDLPGEKRVEMSLTHIHSVGRSRSNVILAGTGVELDRRVKDLDENEIAPACGSSSIVTTK